MQPPEPPGAPLRRRRGDPAFAIRFWSAAVLAPVALLAAWAGGWALGAAVALGAALMAYEWVRMSDPGAPERATQIAVLLGAFVVLLGAGGLWTAALAVLAAAAAAAAWERRKRGSAWRAAFGAFYVCLPCLAMIWIRAEPERGYQALLYLFVVVWSADIGAYLVGSWVGGPKLLPRASPNKTWSGLIAGVTMGATMGAAGFAAMGEAPLVGAALAFPVSLSAVFGDLLESSLKRKFGVKDTGTIIPGHGGVLDRVDALMAAVLAFAILIAIWPAARAGFF